MDDVINNIQLAAVINVGADLFAEAREVR